MAKGDGQTLEKLYFELGLDLSKLQSDILAADRTITENLGRLNRENNTIKLRMLADTAGLDKVKDATKILEIQERALNQQLELSRDKLKILEAAYQSVAQNANATAIAVNKAEQAFLREKIAVGQLEQELRNLNSQKITPAPVNSLLSGYQGIKGDIAGQLNRITSAFNDIATASQSADGAITKSLEIIGSIPHPVGKAVAALASIPLVIKGIENSLLELAKPAIASGDALYVMSRGMQLSIKDMAQLSTIAKVTGIDINEVNNSLRRFSMQITKADDNDLRVQTLQRYGAEITDVNGRLKNAVELVEELGKALKNAEAEGNGAAFRDIVGGKFWSGDTVTLLEDFADNVEQAKKVVKNGLANPTWAHAIQGELNTLNTQAAQLGGVLSSALMPVAAEIIPQTYKRLGELTRVIAENKENIKFLGDVMATPIRLMNEFTDSIISFSAAMDKAKDSGNAFGQFLQSLGEYRDDLGALLNVAPLTALTAMTMPGQGWTKLAINSYSDEIEEFKRERKEMEDAAKAKNDEREARVANTLALKKQAFEQQQKLETALSSMEERRVKNVQDAEDIIYKIRHTSYENSLRDIDNWEQEQLRAIEELNELGKNITGKDNLFDAEENSVYELGNAKRLQLEQETADKLAEIRQQITAGEQTESERRFAIIEKEKQSWIQAGMDKAEAEQLAEQSKANYIQGVEQALTQEITSLRQTDFERRLAQIEQEKQAWIDKGASITQAEQFAQEKIQQLNQEKADKLQQIRESITSAEISESEKRINAIEREKDAWIQAGMDKVEAERLAQQEITQVVMDAQQRVADAQKAYAKEQERIQEELYQKQQQAAEEAARKNEALFNEAISVLKSEYEEFVTFLKNGYEGLQKLEYQKLIKSGIDPKALEAMTPEKLEEFKQAKDEATKSLLPNWYDKYEPEEVSVSLDGVREAADNLAKAFEELEAATSSAAEATGTSDWEYEPTEQGAPVAAYTQPDGSTIVTNYYDNDNGGTDDPLNVISPATLPEDFEQQVQSATQSLEGFDSAIQSSVENLSTMSEIESSFSEIPQIIQSASDSLSDLPVAVGAITQELSNINIPEFVTLKDQVQEVTVRLSDFSSALQNFSLPQNNSASERRQPVEVTTNVSIEEAHAWDSQHISELADRVAEVITPQIISAIGGDSNSY